jgi:hypothetical protein
MEVSDISMGLSALALLVAVYSLSQKRVDTTPPESFSARPLQLQAYERLVLLCERIALPNLISRLSQPDLTAREMQLLMLETIKQEYEYNASQQIYVTQAAWDAVRSLRDQNMLIVNSMSKTLTNDASAAELSRTIMEALIQEERAALHTYVAATLNAEAKKIM